MTKESILPDYIFESSWEVCNKVGGIYTVLSTRAETLQQSMGDRLIFIGPDCWGANKSPYFVEDETLFGGWAATAVGDGLLVKTGRWDVPGHPVAVLVDFSPYFAKKDEIYTRLWEHFGVDSLHAYGDYDEASMFSYAAAKVVESFCNRIVERGARVVYHGNEWMTGLGVLYVKRFLPQVATIFTTHATSIGRSISGNNKPLYGYLSAYDGDRMACELNMQSKHSIEKQTAAHVDCFTTVSDITDRECAALLDKKADVVLPNGFDDNFVPKGAAFTQKRRAARARLLRVANALTGCCFPADTLIISTSGRYEFRNKGIDVFIDAMNRINKSDGLARQAVAFVEVPAWVKEARQDLAARLATDGVYDTPLPQPMLTHWLNNMGDDRILGMMRYLGMQNERHDKVKVIFVPCYLTGNDGIMNVPYYDLLLGKDLCIYPSYYEPWGYTPLEATAFKVPCITTDLAGFGLWADSVKGSSSEIADGVKVIHRTDYNYSDVANAVCDTVELFSHFTKEETAAARAKAGRLSKRALWTNFIKYYHKAYTMALEKAETRQQETKL